MTDWWISSAISSNLCEWFIWVLLIAKVKMLECSQIVKFSFATDLNSCKLNKNANEKIQLLNNIKEVIYTYISFGHMVYICQATDTEINPSSFFCSPTFQGRFTVVSHITKTSIEWCWQLCWESVVKWKTVRTFP